MKLTLTTRAMTGLWRVKLNKILRWPPEIINSENLVHGRAANNKRGSAGYVVDMDSPSEKILCRRQERFLERVPEGEQKAARDRIQAGADFPKPAMNWMISHGFLDGSTRPRRKVRQKIKENEEKADKPSGVLPGLAPTLPTATDVEAPTRRTPRPRKEVDADAVEGS